MRKPAYRPTSYRQRAHYTDSELLEFKIQDLESDIECAERDGQADYADTCRRERDRLIALREETS